MNDQNTESLREPESRKMDDALSFDSVATNFGCARLWGLNIDNMTPGLATAARVYFASRTKRLLRLVVIMRYACPLTIS